VLVGQLVEDMHDSTRMEMLPPNAELGRWAIVGLVVYIVVASNLLRRTWRGALANLRAVVRIPTEQFAAYEARLRLPELGVDVVLLALAAAATLVVFAVFGSPVGGGPSIGQPGAGEAGVLPSSAPLALLVLIGYTTLGWVSLRLVYTTVRSALILRELAGEPLDINVFDTGNLEPFGRVALAVALAPAGVILILLAGLGTPQTLLGWAVLLLASSATLLALLLPLLGIHRRMADAKDGALADLGQRLRVVHEEIGRGELADQADLARLRDTANTLVPMRKTVQEMPAWPFRNTAAFGRAVLVASAPLIYATLNELIRIFWIEPLGG
ncbi:MAG TPA: hypothetical protein VH741_01045, partial [Candidatus Limnocylindrales bacterium]